MKTLKCVNSETTPTIEPKLTTIQCKSNTKFTDINLSTTKGSKLLIWKIHQTENWQQKSLKPQQKTKFKSKKNPEETELKANKQDNKWDKDNQKKKRKRT